MLDDKYSEFEKFIADNKGKRKFKQTVEVAMNFTGVDFAKQDNRLNVEVLLPYNKGSSVKIAVFATDKAVIEEANRNGAEVIDGNSLTALATDRQKLQSLLAYTLLAQPSLMPNIARSLGQFLGPRNKMPKPLVPGSMQKAVTESARAITIKNRGKFLPTVQCVVGSEDMAPKEIFANIKEVISGVSGKVGQGHMKSVYVKLTMSPPLKLM